MSIIITLALGKLTSKHQTYHAFLGDERIVTSRDPEPAVCRKLAQRGYSGRVEFYRGDRPGLIVHDLLQCAKTTTREDWRKGPITEKYKPLPFGRKKTPRADLNAGQCKRQHSKPDLFAAVL